MRSKLRPHQARHIQEGLREQPRTRGDDETNSRHFFDRATKLLRANVSSGYNACTQMAIIASIQDEGRRQGGGGVEGVCTQGPNNSFPVPTLLFQQESATPETLLAHGSRSLPSTTEELCPGLSNTHKVPQTLTASDFSTLWGSQYKSLIFS